MPYITLSTHFAGIITLPNTTAEAEAAVLAVAIAKYEPMLLTKVLGYTMYKTFAENLDASEGIWYKLLNGADFTDKLDRENHWQGLNTVGLNPIANYIYYMIRNQNRTTTTGQGNEGIPKYENMETVGPDSKMKDAWNEMVEFFWIMDDFIRTNETDYPDYIGLDYPPFNVNDYKMGCTPQQACNNEFFQLKTLVL